MIVKTAIATAALASSLGVVAPIALAAGGGDTCGTPTGPAAAEVSLTEASAAVARPASVSARLDPGGAGRRSAASTVRRSRNVSAEPEPAGCQAPAGTGGRLPGADQAVARALRLVGSHGYYQLCARLAANIWGQPRAGYFSAAEQWRQMDATGNAHPGDRLPPAGALVFWATGGPYGHVAVYLGDGRIVSNDIGDDVPGEGGVYLVDFGLIESKWGATYLGWAPPIYSTT